MFDRIASTLSAQGTALQLRGRRQETIASNIANADTPNFKAVDFDFNKAFKQALGSRAGGSEVALQGTRPGHFGSNGGVASNGISSLELATRYRTGGKTALDNNTVDMEVERTQFAANTLKYEAASRALTGSIKTMQSAISGQ